MTPKTKFAKGGSPFQPKAPPRNVDTSTLTIANDPLPGARATPGHKYDEVFAKLKSGQCIVCDGPDAAKIGHALNTWLKQNRKDGVVRTTKAYEGAAPGKLADRS